MLCLFTSDLHGSRRRYDRLLEAAAQRRPEVLLLGGDLLPGLGGEDGGSRRTAIEVLVEGLERLGRSRPRVFFIPGNDDPRAAIEEQLKDGIQRGLLEPLHMRRVQLRGHPLLGYACVPPSPFQLKDWERYDVSRFTDPGSVSPEQGMRSVPADPSEVRYGTIAGDLEKLARGLDLERAICLFHAPPYRSSLDRAALDGMSVEGVPLDLHVGSIAVRRFIEERGPLITLHGHVHEAARLTGTWKERIGRTLALSAAHDGPELALVGFDSDDPRGADRELF